MSSYRGLRTPAEDQRNQKKNRPFEHPSAARLSEVLGNAEQDHLTATQLQHNEALAGPGKLWGRHELMDEYARQLQCKKGMT